MNKYVKRSMALTLSFFILLLLPFSVETRSPRKIVRIGYYTDGNYMFRGLNGQYEGFNFEYLYELSKYVDWEYEIVDCENWETAFAMLQEGRIDLLPSIYRTPEREQKCSFSGRPLCETYSVLNVRANDERYSYEDFEAFQGMRVGVVYGMHDTENFQSYCEKNGLELELSFYADSSELLASLKKGEIDGMAGTHLGKISNLRMVAQFAPEPLYMGVSNSRSDLLLELDAAMEKMLLADPALLSRLYDKYFSVSTDQAPVFTRQEQEYIGSQPLIHAIYYPSKEPLEYTNPSTGGFDGITADFFSKIEEKSGLHFEYFPISSSTEAQRMLLDGEAQLICGVSGDYRWNQTYNLHATRCYLQLPIVLIKRNEGSAIGRFAICEDSALEGRISVDSPTANIDFYSTLEDCLDALLAGKVDATYANTYAADYLLSNNRYKSLVVVRVTNYMDELKIGVAESADPRLFTILDKCVQYTSNEEMDELVLQNTLKGKPFRLEDLLRDYPYGMMGGILMILLLIIGIFSYIVRIKSRASRRVEELLYRDDLTGLWNISKFREETTRLICGSPPGTYALLYLDISQFKTINDAFGFAEGDKVLCLMAKTLQGALLNDECCARMSADHFVLLLQYTGWEALLQRLQEVDQQMDNTLLQRGKKYRLVFRFGVYIVRDLRIQDISLMLDFANYARQSTKATHKSTATLYDENMRREGLIQRDVADRMDVALKKGEFQPYFQAKVDMRTGRIVGSEALLRWNDPERGILPPGRFLPFFEKSRFIVEVDLEICRQVCAAIRRWIDSGIEFHPVSCNFSRLHFEDGNFPEVLKVITSGYGIPPECLELEITEGVIFENQAQVLEQIRTLRAMGFRIDIDDFGTGYSSLGLLEQMPADVLKLDRTFISKGLDQREQSIIRGIVKIASDLDMQILCEGVETTEQVEFLMNAGCMIAQGFYYAKPVSLTDFERRMAEESLEKVR